MLHVFLFLAIPPPPIRLFSRAALFGGLALPPRLDAIAFFYTRLAHDAHHALVVKQRMEHSRSLLVRISVISTSPRIATSTAVPITIAVAVVVQQGPNVPGKPACICWRIDACRAVAAVPRLDVGLGQNGL